MTRWAIGIAFFLLVLAAGAVLRATGLDGTQPAPGPVTSAGVGTTGVSVQTGPEGPTGVTPVTVAAPAEPGTLSADDRLVLAQTDLPPIARVDHSAFPSGDDPRPPASRTLHVAPTGDDAGPGSETRPFRTIERALSAAADGDAVLVHGGVYPSGGLVVTQSGFLLSGAPGEEVVVEADGADAGYGLSVSVAGQHDVTVRGLRFRGFELGVHYGARVPVRRLVLEDLVVEGAAEGMAGYRDPADTVVDGLLVRRVSLLDIGSIGLRFGAGGGRNVRISGLHVSMRPGTEGDPPSDGLVFESGDNVLVEGSIVEGAGGDGIDLQATRAAVVSSVVRHVGRNGIKLWAGGDVVNALVYDTGADAQLATGAGDYRVVNSTFAFHSPDGDPSYAATFGYDAPGADVSVTILNSVFYRQPGPVWLPAAARVRMENNVFWGFPDRLVVQGGRGWTAEDLEGGPSGDPPPLGVGNRAVEPIMVDPPRGDLHPGVGSPLFAAGALGPEVPGFDLLGVPRVESVTAGAFQTTRTGVGHSGATTSTTVPGLTTSTTVPSWTPSFADVVSSDPFAEAILGLAGRGVVDGYPRPGGFALFRPAAPVWRAQFAKMIALTAGLTVSESLVPPFDDLEEDDRASLYPNEYIAAASAAGITQGVAPGAFGPYLEVTRAQMLTMAVRAARSRTPDGSTAPPAEYVGSLGAFDPAHGGSARVAEFNGMTAGIPGFGAAWDPWAPASRGEVAQVLWNLSRWITERTGEG